jgi:hypothetical protein
MVSTVETAANATPSDDGAPPLQATGEDATSATNPAVDIVNINRSSCAAVPSTGAHAALRLGRCEAEKGPEDSVELIAELAALPLALARTPLCFIAMIAVVDSEDGARRLAAEMARDVAWALAIVRDHDRWQAAFI